MTSKYDHIASTKYLSNLCKDGTPLRGRIALLCFRNEISARVMDTAIMLIEYSQLLSVFLRATQKFYTQAVLSDVELFNVVEIFAKVVSPGAFLPLNQQGLPTIKRVLIFCFSFYLFRIGLFLYIIWLAWNRKTSKGLLVQTWQWIFHLQTKFLFFVFASVYSNVYDNIKKGTIDVGSEYKYPYMVGLMVMIAWEFALALVLITQFTNVLPFKRFTASKDNKIEMNVLLQKWMNYMLRRVFSISIDASKWVYGVMNIAFGLVRIYRAFQRLPMYNLKGLKLQMHLLVSTFTLSIACFMNLALHMDKVNMNFIIITWIILTILCTKFAFDYLDKRLWELAFEKGINTKRSPELLVHKVIFIKKILTGNMLPTDITSKANIYHLLCSTLTQTSISNFDLKSLDLQDKVTRNKVFSHYLEDLMTHFPKNNFLKLYIAYRYAQKSKFYGLSIKTLAEMESTNYPTVVTSKYILYHFIQTKTQSDYQYGAYQLNVYDYCRGVAELSKMKLKMVEQAKLQWSLCNEITSASPDLAKILRLGNKAQSLKKQIHKKFNKLYEQVPDFDISPSLLYANYSLFLRYSSEDHFKYKEISSKMSQKFQKQFETDRLFQENLFQEDTFFIVVSGEKETAGRINYISPGGVTIFGRDLTGSHVSTTTPPFIRPNTSGLVKALMGPNALVYQNTERFQLFYHVTGYLVPVNYYLNINPSIYGGLSFAALSRCENSGKEYILLNQEGEIESFTKGIGELLGLFCKNGGYELENKIPINQVCPELVQVNQAFNIVATGETKIPLRHTSTIEKPSAEISQLISLEEAKEVCSIYSSEKEGKEIILQANHISFPYRCSIKTLMVGTKIGKILTLQKIHVSNQEIVIIKNDTQNNSQNNSLEIDEQDLQENISSINVDRLKSDQHTILLTTRNDNNFHLHNTLSSSRNLITPRLPLLMAKKETATEIHEKSPLHEKTPDSDEIVWKAVNLQEAQKTKFLEKYKPKWLRNNQPKITKVYQQALNKSSSPFFYHVFIAAFYTLFLIIFIMYLHTSVVMRQGIYDLQGYKKILRLAEERNNYLGTLDGSTRFLWTYATQPSSITDAFEGTFVSLSMAKMLNQIATNSIEDANNQLYDLTNSLTAEQRDFLFENDIRMFDENSTAFINMTSFQAADQILEASLKSNDLAETDLNSAVPYLQYVLRNVMNDMLIKNTKISQSFWDAFEGKKSQFEGWINLGFGISLSFLILIVFAFAYILYLQAKNETNNLYALTRLKHDSIQNLKQDFLVFQNLALEDDNSTSELDDTKKDSASKQVKQQQHQVQSPVERGLWPIYYFNFLKVCVLILIPIGLFSLNFVLFRRYLDHLSTKASQIYFTEKMSSRLGVISSSFLEVTSENDTTIIKNIQASVSLSNQISHMSDMISSVSDTLGVGTSENNDIIQDILYGDACSYLKYSDYQYSLCQELANYQEKPGLTNLLSNLESSMTSLYSKFINSERTEQDLLDLQVEVYNEFSAYAFLVIIMENNQIADILNTDFEEIIINSQAMNVILTVVILALLVVESFVVHFLIINKLKQKEKQFKQILGLFPASVVLPNFILKSYIMKASNQTFNSFRENA